MSDAPSDAAASHWCYHCNKRVVVETLDDLVVCCECNKGFVESIQPIPAAYSSSAAPPPPPPLPLSPDLTVEDSSIGSHFLQMLRLLADAPSQRSSPQIDVSSSYEDDFFRLELNSRNEIEDEDEDEEEEEDEEGGNDEEEEEEEENLTVNDEEEEEEEEDEEGEDLVRRNRREIFPLTTRSRTGRNRILDWAEILMGIEDNSIEFRMETDRYAGNPGDYIEDAAGYEALLQNLAEGDGGGGRRGAPPAGKLAIEALETFEVGSSDNEGDMSVVVCAVCKDAMVIGETVKKLPCGHCYHGNCIVPWLGTRNSCPVCRFQLQTDDADYEEERKKRTTTIFTDSPAAASSSSSPSTPF